MVITEFLERNARLYGSDTALVELNPSQERDSAVTWREASLIESAENGAPYRRELSWADFDRRANRFANLLLSRGLERETKVGILMMNCLEWLPIYFGILKAGGVAVPLNFRYSAEEIKYCLELADVERSLSAVWTRSRRICRGLRRCFFRARRDLPIRKTV